jgi:hypothetical protein
MECVQTHNRIKWECSAKGRMLVVESWEVTKAFNAVRKHTTFIEQYSGIHYNSTTWEYHKWTQQINYHWEDWGPVVMTKWGKIYKEIKWQTQMKGEWLQETMEWRRLWCKTMYSAGNVNDDDHCNASNSLCLQELLLVVFVFVGIC